MAKRGRGAGADADTPASEDMLKAGFMLLCKAYVLVSVEGVPSGDQLKHHALWVRSRSAARAALLPTRTRRDSTRCLPFVRSGRRRPAGSSSHATAPRLRTRG